MEDDNIIVIIFFIGIICFFGGAIAGTIEPMWNNKGIKTIGQAICEQEYGLDFDKYEYDYFSTKLYCEPKKIEKLEEKYAGIIINLKNKEE